MRAFVLAAMMLGLTGAAAAQEIQGYGDVALPTIPGQGLRLKYLSTQQGPNGRVVCYNYGVTVLDKDTLNYAYVIEYGGSGPRTMVIAGDSAVTLFGSTSSCTFESFETVTPF